MLQQYIAAAAPHDAVTAQALALQDVLGDVGLETTIVAEHIDPRLAGRVMPLSRAIPDLPVLLRYSIWSAAAEQALTSPAPLGLVYHNITPAHLLAGENAKVAALCNRGRRELPRFAPRARVAVADSPYNAAELHAAGFTDVHTIDLLLDLAPSSSPAAAAPPPILLYVGRLAPSKRLEDLIDVLALVRSRIPAASLRMVGRADAFPQYVSALRRHAALRGVADAVEFTGLLSDLDRDDSYRGAGVFITMSEHEGYCVPLLEAMSFGLPVVARDAGAVRDTAGGGALLIPGRNVPLAAAAVERLLTDASVRQGLASNARVRLQAVRRDDVARRLVDCAKALVA